MEALLFLGRNSFKFKFFVPVAFAIHKPEIGCLFCSLKCASSRKPCSYFDNFVWDVIFSRIGNTEIYRGRFLGEYRPDASPYRFDASVSRTIAASFYLFALTSSND